MSARWPVRIGGWAVLAGIGCTSPAMESHDISLLNTTTTWSVEDRVYSLEAEGWRSFQPVVRHANGDPLIVVVRLQANGPIGGGIGGFQLIKGESAWSPPTGFEVRKGSGPNETEYVIRGGPVDWLPGETVHVVASAYHGGASALLRTQFVIARVD